MTLPEHLEQIAAAHPGKAALVFQDAPLSYQDLAERVNRCAAGLARLGVGRGSAVGILSRNCPEFVITFYAAGRLGAMAVPTNFLLKPEEFAFIARDAGISVLVVQPGFVETVNRVRDTLPDLKHVVQTGPQFDGVGQGDPPAPLAAREHDPAIAIYTSGTTGKPKGALLTHHNLLTNLDSCVQAIELSERDVFLCLLPMFHSFAWTTCVLLPLHLGGTSVIVESVQPAQPWIKMIGRYGVTMVLAVPPIYAALMKVTGLKGLGLRWMFRSIRVCVSGAAALPVPVLEGFQHRFHIPLLEGYGLTEASPVVSLNPLHGSRKAGSIGLPIPRVEVRIVDEAGKDVVGDGVGEILVRGGNVMAGYHHHPEATAEAIRDGWLHTGDMARRDSDGYLYIVDRKKDLVIVKGENVYPKEVEDTLAAHPAVADSAVVGVPDETGDERIVAFVILKDGASTSRQELGKHCRARLAGYKVPRLFEFRGEFPKTALGKVMKAILRQDAAALVRRSP